MLKHPPGLRTALSGILLLSVLASVPTTIQAQNLSQSLPASAAQNAPFYERGRFSQAVAAEISAYDPGTKRLFTVSPGGLEITDLSNPSAPLAFTPVAPVDLTGSNSVDVHAGLVAVAVQADPKTDPGAVVFLNADGVEQKRVTVGALPDMLKFTPDGQKVLVANEGELGELPEDGSPDPQVDPEGSVSIIDLSDGVENAAVTPVRFTQFNSQVEQLRGQGVRISAFNAVTTTLAQDLEPEYIAIAEDGATAWVTLQENNAVAALDIAGATFRSIFPLGYKDFSRGLPALTTYPVTNLPSLGRTAPSTAFPQGQEIHLGGFSGLFYEGETADGKLKFITTTDRGPNGEPTQLSEAIGLARPFVLPDFQPQLVRLELDPASGAVTLTQRIGLKRADGSALTGLPNLQAQAAGLAYTDETPIDLFGSVLPNDPLGIDSEGIVVDPDDQSFWMVDEYRPSIYHFDSDGKLIQRYIPQGTAAALEPDAAPGTFGSEVLPAAYAQRRANRGFEALALDGNLLYAFIQSPIDNPDTANDANSKASRVLRILAFNTQTETVASEYLYILNDPTGSGEAKTDKIGDAFALGNGRFYVAERDDRTGADSNKLIYEIDLKGATDVLGYSGPTRLESMTPDQLSAASIRPVYKQKVANLAAIGYTGVSKLEGLAFVDADTFAVINDNDFGVQADPIPGDGSVPMRATPEPILLGLVNFSQSNGLDPSDRDGASSGKAIQINPWPVFGMFMPDGIASFTTNGQTYLITANEGDDRSDFLTVDERSRVSTLTLDPTVFPNATALKNNAALGRLRVTNRSGDLDGDSDYDRLFTYGARSFSIWDTSGDLVYDSGDLLERLTAELSPTLFNADSGNPALWDERSPAKGPEAESVAVGRVNGKLYAFIGIERSGGGAMIFDISNPHSPVFVQYVRNDLDISPEGVLYIAGADSPSGLPLLVLSHEVANSQGNFNVTLYGSMQFIHMPLVYRQ